MKITSTSPNFKQIEENQAYEINYGAIKKGSNTKVEILFEDVEYLSHSKSCGCTNPEITLLNNGFTLTIKYDSLKVGTINQQVKVNTMDKEKKTTKIIFNLKGQVL